MGKRASFLRSYAEIWLIWATGNVALGWATYFKAKFARELAPRPFTFVESLADPFMLVTNVVIVLVVAILVRHRQSASFGA